MKKKHKIDFVLYEDEYEKLIFRFLPQKSTCHSFDDKLPTKWEEVYKVYYAYKIFRKWKNDGDRHELFYCDFDECSVVREISERIKYIVEDKEVITVNYDDEEYVIQLLNNELQPLGDGVSWTVNKKTNIRKEHVYEVILWKYNETGCRFYLEKDRFKEFGEYLSECCEYMLAHGDPI